MPFWSNCKIGARRLRSCRFAAGRGPWIPAFAGMTGGYRLALGRAIRFVPGLMIR